MAFLGASFLGARVGGSGACGPAAALVSGFVRSPLVTRWRNKGVAPKWDKSNKGKQNWYKGRGVGLHGALNKQGRFRRTLDTFVHTNLLIPALDNFALKPYVVSASKFPAPKPASEKKKRKSNK